MHRNQSKKYFNQPGFYKMIVGDFEVTALSDGPYLLDMNKLLFNAKLGEKLILIDARCSEPMAQTLRHLKAAC